MTAGPDTDRSVRAVVEAALAAYADLGGLGEEVEDEWTYVTDLVAAHTADLQALADTQPGRLLDRSAIEAVGEAIAEIRLVTDPHRAIDWLSTFPAVVELAVGAAVGGLDGTEAAPGPAGEPERTNGPA